MMARIEIADGAVSRRELPLRPPQRRQRDRAAPLANEGPTLARLSDRAERTGTKLQPEGDSVTIVL